MAGYIHGVTTQEIPTSLKPTVQVDSAFPVVVGTAPVHTLEEGAAAPINEPRLIFTQTEFVAQFGAVPEGEDMHAYSLSEFADLYFGSYNVAPVAFINVFDPAQHKSPPEGGEDAGDLPDVGMVTSADVIGGISQDLKKTGMELVSEIFPRFSLPPGQILAPGFSGDPAVALTLGAKCAGINGHFKATGIIDVPDEVPGYTDVPAWIKDNNLTDQNLIAMLGKARLGDALNWGSSHLAGVIAQRDAENAGIPYWSPSNKRMLCNGLMHAGKELVLGNEEAQWLNGQGVVTGLNFIGGLRAWGNRTAAYPGVTDPKDTFIPLRRMFNFVTNTLVLTAWQMLDSPITRVLVDTVTDTFNVWLNGLTARKFLLGGRVVFLSDENPTTDLMDGICRFHVYLAPPSPARHIEFILEYDPSYLSTLFAA